MESFQFRNLPSPVFELYLLPLHSLEVKHFLEPIKLTEIGDSNHRPPSYDVNKVIDVLFWSSARRCEVKGQCVCVCVCVCLSGGGMLTEPNLCLAELRSYAASLFTLAGEQRAKRRGTLRCSTAAIPPALFAFRPCRPSGSAGLQRSPV